MDRANLNYFIDALMILFFLLTGITGIIKMPSFPFVFRQGIFQVITKVHDYSGFIFLVLVIIHLILHFLWIKCMTKTLLDKFKDCD